MTTRSRVDLRDLGALLVTSALLLLAGLGVTGPMRLLLALAFVTFVPGWALLSVIDGRLEGMARLALAVALSLTLCTGAAQVLLWLHLWSPTALLAGLGGLSVVVLGRRWVST